MTFKISALPAERFAHLFDQNEETLRTQGVERRVVDECPGAPCRVSLEDVALGERVLLLNYEHLPSRSPYRASHAIFIKEGARQAKPLPNEIPESLRRRLLSVRAFDAADMMLDADVVSGTELERVVEHMLADKRINYLHVHNAKQGCYHARVDRH